MYARGLPALTVLCRCVRFTRSTACAASSSPVRAPRRALPSHGASPPSAQALRGHPAGSWRARGPVPYSMAALWRRPRPPAVSGLCRTLRALSGTRYPRGSGPAAAAPSPLPVGSGFPRLLTPKSAGEGPPSFSHHPHMLDSSGCCGDRAASPLYPEAGRAAAASIREGSGSQRRTRRSCGAHPSAPGR